MLDPMGIPAAHRDGDLLPPVWVSGSEFNERNISMSENDPFSTVVPFQVPEQVRAFAEKGVSQARESYQKLKEAAETNNGAIEAAYTSATKGAGDFTAKVIE